MTYIKLTRSLAGIEQTEIHYVRKDLIKEFTSHRTDKSSWIWIEGHEDYLPVDQSVEEIKQLIDNEEK